MKCKEEWTQVCENIKNMLGNKLDENQENIGGKFTEKVEKTRIKFIIEKYCRAIWGKCQKYVGQ